MNSRRCASHPHPIPPGKKGPERAPHPHVRGSSRASKVRNAGFSLLESAVSVLLVAVLVVAALNAVGAARTTRYRMTERERGELLAQMLMSEVLAQAYRDPQSSFGFGPNSSEATGDRSLFDDVDDYHNWTASPPQDSAGNAVPGFDTAWSRSVTVAWVNANNLSTTASSESGVKAIHVAVRHRGRIVAEQTAYRANVLTVTDTP